LVSRALVDEFMAGKTLAVLGVTRKRGRFGAVIFRTLREKGYRVFPVNPSAETIEGEPCYATPADLPEPVDGAVLIVNRRHTPEAVRGCIDASVPRIWIQPESRSLEGERLAEAAGVSVISGECILLFAEPAGFIHRVHRGIRRMLGRMPR
jgi:predicted CoA-binding protein